MGEGPALHVLCFLTCWSRHGPVASNLLVTSPAFSKEGLCGVAFPSPAGQVSVSPGQGIQRILEGLRPSPWLAGVSGGPAEKGWLGPRTQTHGCCRMSSCLSRTRDGGRGTARVPAPRSAQPSSSSQPKSPNSRAPGSRIPLCQTPGADAAASRNFPGILLCCPRVTPPRVTWWPAVVLYQHPASADARPAPRGRGCSPPPRPRRRLPGPAVLVSALTVAPGWNTGSGHVSPLPVPGGTGHSCGGSWQYPSPGA